MQRSALQCILSQQTSIACALLHNPRILGAVKISELLFQNTFSKAGLGILHIQPLSPHKSLLKKLLLPGSGYASC